MRYATGSSPDLIEHAHGCVLRAQLFGPKGNHPFRAEHLSRSDLFDGSSGHKPTYTSQHFMSSRECLGSMKRDGLCSAWGWGPDFFLVSWEGGFCVRCTLKTPRHALWPWGRTNGDPILGCMNIHLPPMLMFTRGFQVFDPQPCYFGMAKH